MISNQGFSGVCSGYGITETINAMNCHGSRSARQKEAKDPEISKDLRLEKKVLSFYMVAELWLLRFRSSGTETNPRGQDP